MKKNKHFFLHALALPYLLSQFIDEIDKPEVTKKETLLVGGQAIMEGVMMRNGASYACAVRKPDNTIVVSRNSWRRLFRGAWTEKFLLRGFPVLLDTLYNGISALNESVALTEGDAQQKLTTWQIVSSLILAVAMALLLFVLTPHLLSLLMFKLNLGENVDGIFFHLWDGFFKACIFLSYIRLVSILPEIRRVFCYHGAEHKTIHAFEAEGNVSAYTAQKMSRLHPRCGTTFLLFVVSISILLHAVLTPLLLWCYTPDNELYKQAFVLAFKLLLVVPISMFSYELIRLAATLSTGGFAAILLQAPGLALQRLTTEEPDLAQLEVAVIALYESLNPDERKDRFELADYVKKNQKPE